MDSAESKKQVINEIVSTFVVPAVAGVFFFLWVYGFIKATVPGTLLFPLSSLILILLYFFSGSVYSGILLGLVTIVGFLSVVLADDNASRFLYLLESLWVWGIFFVLEYYQQTYLNEQNKIREEEEVLDNKIAYWEVEIAQNEARRNSLARQIANYQSLGQILQLFGAALQEEKIIKLMHESAASLIGRGEWKIKKDTHRDVFASYIKERRVPLIIRNLAEDNRFCVENPKFSSMVAVPVEIGGDLWGVLEGTSRQPETFDESDLRLLSILCGIASLALNNVLLYQKTQELAITDGLTGLYVHSYFRERLGEEMILSIRHKLPLTIAIMDIDHFKTFNDTYGHTAGDTVLRQLADLLRHRLRETDFLCRYGGEEFAVIMLQTDTREAHKVCEEIRASVEAERFYLPIESFKPVQVHATISIGIAKLDDGCKTEKDFVLIADEALYKAKRHGRNRVEIGLR